MAHTYRKLGAWMLVCKKYIPNHMSLVSLMDLDADINVNYMLCWKLRKTPSQRGSAPTRPGFVAFPTLPHRLTP